MARIAMSPRVRRATGHVTGRTSCWTARRFPPPDEPDLDRPDPSKILSVIVVQAAAERRVLPAGREPTADVLESIERTGRQTMTELRRLRACSARATASPRPHRNPGLSRLGDLVAEVRQAGV